VLGAAYYIITESEWIVTVFDWISEKWSSLSSSKHKYSGNLNSKPDSIGDSDEDEQIVTSKNKGAPAQRSKPKEDLEFAGKDETGENLIDINKYHDSDDDKAELAK